MARDPIADVQSQIKREQNMYDNPDPDGSEDQPNIDDELEKITGNSPRLDQSATFLSDQIDDDELSRGEIAPHGSDAGEQ